MTGGQGNLTAAASAKQLIERIDALDESTAGRFWHADGTELPW